MFSEKFENDLKLLGFTIEEVIKIERVLTRDSAYREKEILITYDSMEFDEGGSVVLNIYGENREGFGIDARKDEKTFGEIVC